MQQASIHLGLTAAQKQARILSYCAGRGLEHVVFLSPDKFGFPLELPRVRSIDWPEIIMYRTFYPLLQEINRRTLVVINECLRTQNRHDLTYNCIRHFLNQAGHVLIFQWLPLIDAMQDFMILFDFATGSRWKRERYDVDLLAEIRIEIMERQPVFHDLPVPTDQATRAAYDRTRAELFRQLGARDPHTIPRNLYLLGGKAKSAAVPIMRHLVGRNNRLKLERMATYREDSYPAAPYVIFELPHNFIDLADFSTLAEQSEFDVLAADLKVDRWYLDRYTAWAQRIADGYADLRRFAQCA